MQDDTALTGELEALLAEQTASGAFPSTVDGPDGPLRDETCFVTAQMVLLLCDIQASHADLGSGAATCIGTSVAAALDFVEQCAVDSPSGTFAFYPPKPGTARLDIDIPADVDDTALAWMALMAGGRRTRGAARIILANAFNAVTVLASRRGDPPFVRRSLLRTWFEERGGSNPVDLVVNVNALAALAMAGADPVIWRDLTAAVARSLPADVPGRSELRSLAPYYAHGIELHHALIRARRYGAVLPVSSALLDRSVTETDADPLTRPLYCNAHGRPLWRAPVLQRARDLRERLLVSQGVDPSIVSGGPHDVHAQIRSCRT